MYSIIMLCAGKGTRTELGYNKMFYQYENKTVYEMVMKTCLDDEMCGQILVVTQPQEREKFKALLTDQRIEYVDGGLERQDSVYAGLLKAKHAYVLIHDGARPFVKAKHIEMLLTCLQTYKACVLMVPCKDTIKKVVDYKVVETLQRDSLMHAQTPQAFHKETILSAYQRGISEKYQATDDAQMVEMYGDAEVHVVVGDYENIKITTPEDLKGIKA